MKQRDFSKGLDITADEQLALGLKGNHLSDPEWLAICTKTAERNGKKREQQCKDCKIQKSCFRAFQEWNNSQSSIVDEVTRSEK